MYSISEVSKLTGITAFTLRFYEKAGILPNPPRKDGKENGRRRYDDQDIRFIRFIHGLKQTGMKLEDIASFVEDGCLLNPDGKEIPDIRDSLHKRMDILDKHIDWLEQQMKQLEQVKTVALEKKTYYSAMLNDQ
ncbi:MerR family transcriptional regulator [Paenibacillus rhizophilus]|uniref:MerR family transcriptional regulator n=1 Tax=Paenibacillus rhizophilus TaxID=1850366 RepID=A0A3N9P8C7_9BACL|nr:MerR family transcriptional regulator [Paenibacillus rhizophilus]RQW12513.1 MerR family transcriptional regulator [Paenibacillus rhizophilus]